MSRSSPVLAAALLVGGFVSAQEEQAPMQDPVAVCGKVAEAWLAGDQASQPELEKVVRALFVDRAAGLKWLAAQVPAAVAAPSAPRSKGVMTLVTHEMLEFLKREHASEWRYAGQFEPLAVLQPVVGEQLFRLLLDTPEWYPNTHRVELVPALRDLQAKPPSPGRFAAVKAIADNAELEPIGLRRALAGLLWQWGDKSCAQSWLDELQANTVDGDAEDRVVAMLELAEFQYQLRDYAGSARTHRAMQSMAKAAGVPLKPVDYYGSACVHNLSGQRERALDQLRTCLQLLAADNLDSSHKLSRELFEKDPEIAALREDPEIVALIDRVLPKKADKNDGVKR
ncbi:MAG: hypothetical protein H6838_02790 [Planctomycetes bacterium]|nr:hypothetical protein [Planctomycetota bacterium]MCB9884387.1 hypothetical protein [Planctomycetota bacterium]